jgi:hypothetical protein
MVLPVTHQCNESVADLEADVVAREQLKPSTEHQPPGLVSWDQGERAFPTNGVLVGHEHSLKSWYSLPAVSQNVWRV